MEGISNEELESLECPTYEKQEQAWDSILDELNDEKINNLLNTVNFELVEKVEFNESCGVINKIFILNARNKEKPFESKDLILRINNPHAFWKQKRNANEVAIMRYLKANSSIPVPLILSHSNDSSASPLGCEYILMERIKGRILSDLIDSANDEQIEFLIEQMFEFVGEIKAIKIKQNKIGCFDEEMNVSFLVHDGPTLEVCDNYLEYIDKQLVFSAKEMKKFKKHQHLGEQLENVRLRLNEIVKLNPNLNSLDFNDQKSVFHGDLNGSNIMLDPASFKINAILDWDFCSYNFDNGEFEFLLTWSDNDRVKEIIKAKLENKIKSWYQPPNGKQIRKYFFDLAQTANQLGFYVSTWFSKEKAENSVESAPRKHINKYADDLFEMLSKIEAIFSLLENYK